MDEEPIENNNNHQIRKNMSNAKTSASAKITGFDAAWSTISGDLYQELGLNLEGLGKFDVEGLSIGEMPVILRVRTSTLDGYNDIREIKDRKQREKLGCGTGYDVKRLTLNLLTDSTEDAAIIASKSFVIKPRRARQTPNMFYRMDALNPYTYEEITTKDIDGDEVTKKVRTIESGKLSKDAQGVQYLEAGDCLSQAVKSLEKALNEKIALFQGIIAELG